MLPLFFIKIGWLDLIDIALVAILLFQLYRLLKGSVAINIFIAIISIYLLWLVVKALNMQLLGKILGQFIGVGVIAVIIVFQQELRRFLVMVGTTGFFRTPMFARRIFNLASRKNFKVDINAIVRACKSMSDTKTGAIIVLATGSDLKFYANTGESIQAKVSQRLIESIFYKNNPLHDGAIIVHDNKIKAARCVLPVTENPDFPTQLGMRHRAAVGITETSDAVAIAVSEQTGEISLSVTGQLRSNLTPDELRALLEEFFSS